MRNSASNSVCPAKMWHLIRARIQAIALVVEPNVVLDIVGEDPDDNRVLECAVTGEANYVVTGDRHLLKFGSIEGIPILTTRQFMDIVEAENHLG
jgi:uncharacterized protein